MRHAESEFNAVGNLIGGCSPETPLTEKEKEQAIALGNNFTKETSILIRLIAQQPCEQKKRLNMV